MVAGAQDGSLSVFELGRPKQERFSKHLAWYQGRPGCRVVAWRDSAREIITASEDGIVTVWSARDGHPLFVLQAATAGSAITQMAWLEDRQQLITCAKDKKIKVWHFPRIWYDEEKIPVHAPAKQATTQKETAAPEKQEISINPYNPLGQAPISKKS